MDVTEKYDAWSFGVDETTADNLLDLVLQGKKFATASLYDDYMQENQPLPKEGTYSVLMNGSGEAVCVIRDYEVRVEPFDRVSQYHGYAEGEEERNLEAWRRIHREFWQNDFKRLGLADASASQVVLEKFNVVHVAPNTAFNPEILDDFFLIEPNIRYEKQIVEYREEMLAANSSMDGCLSLKRMPDPKEWVDYSYEWGNPLRELKENGMRGTLLMMIRKTDDRLIGMTQIRAIPQNHPLYFVGHIGYSVRPSERRKGYATKMLNKALDFLKYGLGISRAMISALPENEASKRTILANGGKWVGQAYDDRDNVTLDSYCIDMSTEENN